MADPQCIKTYYQTTMMPKVTQSMGFYYSQTPKKLHCVRTAHALRLRRPLSPDCLEAYVYMACSDLALQAAGHRPTSNSLEACIYMGGSNLALCAKGHR